MNEADLDEYVLALTKELRQARDECRKMAAFLERQGYRKCDIQACNCGSWHKWEAR